GCRLLTDCHSASTASSRAPKRRTILAEHCENQCMSRWFPTITMGAGVLLGGAAVMLRDAEQSAAPTKPTVARAWTSVEQASLQPLKRKAALDLTGDPNTPVLCEVSLPEPGKPVQVIANAGGAQGFYTTDTGTWGGKWKKLPPPRARPPM